MNSSIAGIQSAQPTKSRQIDDSPAPAGQRIDVTGLPATQVAEYLQASREEVYFERLAGKTYVVAGDQTNR